MDYKDVPIRDLSEDEFHIGKHINALCEYIKNVDTPITIGLQGEWGSGKSSFMRAIEQNLCNKSLPDAERFDSIWVTCSHYLLLRS